MPMLIYCKGRVCRNQPYECWDSHGTDAFSAEAARLLVNQKTGPLFPDFPL